MNIPADQTGHGARIRELLVGQFSQATARHPAMAENMAETCLNRPDQAPRIAVFSGNDLQPDHLVVVNDDMPYLLDTVLMVLRRTGCRIGQVVHPILPVRRDGLGQLLALSGGRYESVICVEMLDDIDITALQDELRRCLARVPATLQAEAPIRHELANLIDMIPDSSWEVKTFLGWLMEEHFVPFSLSLWREGAKGPFRLLHEAGLTMAAQVAEVRDLAVVEHAAPLRVGKLARRSPIIRDSLFDMVVVRLEDSDSVRVAVLVGLFDPPLASMASREIPYLRRKVARILEMDGVAPQSHNEKHLRQIIEILPREVLFTDDPQQILAQAHAILEGEESPSPRCFTNPMPGSELTLALVLMPRDRFRPELEIPVRALLEREFGGKVAFHRVQMDEYGQARVQAYLQDCVVDEESRHRVEQGLVLLLRSWDDDLSDALAAIPGPEDYWQSRYVGAFPTSYRETFSVTDGITDIAAMERALARGTPVYRFNHWGLTLFSPHAPVPLSAVLPMVEGVGLRSLAQSSHLVKVGRTEQVWIQVFEMETDNRLENNVALWLSVTELFEALGQGHLESDPLNALALNAALEWREIALVRAIARYLRQVENSLSMPHMARVLNRNGTFVRALVNLFHARHEPRAIKDEGRHLAILAECQAAITDGEDDRVADFFRQMVLAVLRTNFYQTLNGSPKDRIVLKLDSQSLPFLPQPVPYVETWVYAPQVEGIHLRGGPVARGGLRWSDRPDDFRTEILGLMKAQRVKNAVIVPVGAKGGFVLRQPSTGGRDAVLAQAKECYSTFIRGLLDITDTIREDQVVSPLDTVVRDGQDPYLVVAADKGTATFSDIANGVAAEYGFWLGDSFASGGSAGYDHKAMGITARGAWVAVRRHFLEMGIDPNAQDITVAGVGDMSGDVFGNGMLLSRHIRLVAAFDHRHIFIDPSPDPAVSWTERNRLFQLPRSSWGDYNTQLLSQGGGIYDRNSKSITLSEAACWALGVDSPVMTPSTLIRTILAAPVDLLWFGGIGTYVKSSGETNADVGDKAGDGVRVDAVALRAKVIGEGANLGLTQRARIEFARRGGRINTDAIDNSAGVDCSDHEVNIKILLNLALAEKRLAEPDRNPLLVTMTEAVGDLVLANNQAQTRVLSLMESQSAGALDDYMRLIRRLEREIGLDRAIEFLPSDELLGERGVVDEGLTRPELAVVLAYTKMWVYRELILTDLPEAKLAEGVLQHYFPPDLWAVAGDVAGRHRLRREIVATEMTNKVVDHLGPLFIPKVMERSGADFARVFGAVLAACAALDLGDLWRQAGGLPGQGQIFASVAKDVEKLVVRLLARVDDLDQGIALLAEGRRNFLPIMESLLPQTPAAALSETRSALVGGGLAAGWADLVACLGWFTCYPDLAFMARSQGRDIERIAHVHFRIGEVCHLDLVRRAAEGIRARTPWHRLAASALIDDTDDLQALITASVVREDSDQAAGSWLQSRSTVLAEIDRTVGEVAAGRDPDLAALIVVGRQIRGGLCR